MPWKWSFLSPEVPEGHKRDKKNKSLECLGDKRGTKLIFHKISSCILQYCKTQIFNVLQLFWWGIWRNNIKFIKALIINNINIYYFPMQELENSEYQLVKYSSNEYWAEIFLASDKKWYNSLLHSILHFISPFI